MQDRLSTADSIRALLVAVGFRHSESKEFAATILSANKLTLDNTIREFLSSLLKDSLLLHVENAIKRLLRQTKVTSEYVWDLLLLIWNNAKYNICVASHRLQSAIKEIAKEQLPCVIPIRPSRKPILVAAAS
jgi:hypothetical protein